MTRPHHFCMNRAMLPRVTLLGKQLLRYPFQEVASHMYEQEGSLLWSSACEAFCIRVPQNCRRKSLLVSALPPCRRASTASCVCRLCQDGSGIPSASCLPRARHLASRCRSRAKCLAKVGALRSALCPPLCLCVLFALLPHLPLLTHSFFTFCPV